MYVHLDDPPIDHTFTLGTNILKLYIQLNKKHWSLGKKKKSIKLNPILLIEFTTQLIN